MPETQSHGTPSPQDKDSAEAVNTEQTSPEEEQKTYGALKCYFYTPKRGDIRGAFCLLFDGANGELLENVFWVTLALDGCPVDVHLNWQEFNKSLPEMGTYEKPLGDKMIPLLLEIFPLPVRADIFRNAEESCLSAGHLTELRRSYERLTHYFLDFETELERLSRKELVDAGVLAKEKSEGDGNNASGDEKEQKSFEGTLITCLPIIDPARGTPVSELRPGDLIEVKIQGGVGASGLIRQYLTSTSQDAIFPVEAVEKKTDDKVYVILSINEEIRGLLTLTKDLRLRTLRTVSRKKKPITVNGDSIIFFGTLLAAIVVILMVVRFLFF